MTPSFSECTYIHIRPEVQLSPFRRRALEEDKGIYQGFTKDFKFKIAKFRDEKRLDPDLALSKDPEAKMSENVTMYSDFKQEIVTSHYLSHETKLHVLSFITF